MLDELILGGEIQETSKKKVLSAIQAQDSLQEVRTAIIKASVYAPFTSKTQNMYRVILKPPKYVHYRIVFFVFHNIDFKSLEVSCFYFACVYNNSE